MITKATRSVLPSQTWLLLEREEFATMVSAYWRAHEVMRSESATPVEKRQATDQLADAMLLTSLIEGQQCALARRAIVDYGDPRDEDYWGVVVSETGFTPDLLIRAVRQMHELTGATFPAFIYRNENEAPISGISAEVLARVERTPERFVLFMAETDEAADEDAEQTQSGQRGRVPTVLELDEDMVADAEELADELERQGLPSSQVYRVVRESLLGALGNHFLNDRDRGLREAAEWLIDDDKQPGWHSLRYSVYGEYNDRARQGLVPPLGLTFDQISIAFTMREELEALPLGDEHPIDTLIRFVAALNAGEVALPADAHDRKAKLEEATDEGRAAVEELTNWVNNWWAARYPVTAPSGDEADDGATGDDSDND